MCVCAFVNTFSSCSLCCASFCFYMFRNAMLCRPLCRCFPFKFDWFITSHQYKILRITCVLVADNIEWLQKVCVSNVKHRARERSRTKLTKKIAGNHLNKLGFIGEPTFYRWRLWRFPPQIFDPQIIVSSDSLSNYPKSITEYSCFMHWNLFWNQNATKWCLHKAATAASIAVAADATTTNTTE